MLLTTLTILAIISGGGARVSAPSVRTAPPRVSAPSVKVAPKPTTPKVTQSKPASIKPNSTAPRLNSSGQSVAYKNHTNPILYYVFFFWLFGQHQDKCYDTNHKEIKC